MNRPEADSMKYWEIIAANLSKAEMKNDYAQTVLLMWKSVTLVCDSAVKLNKFLFADSKLRCVADCCVTAVVIVEVVRRACCGKAVGVILYKLA
jgi:hypothetical protein